MVHKGYKSILVIGMLFFCSVSANWLPDMLYSRDSEEVFVQDLGSEEVKRDDLSIPRLVRVNKIRLRRCDNWYTYERIGYIFQNKAWTDQNSEGLYCYLSKERLPIFKDGNIFYFQELERKVISNKRDNSTETDYENNSGSDSCSTTQEFDESEDESA